MNRIVVLGGYGTFGSPLVRGLSSLPVEIVVAGRERDKARALIERILPCRARLRAAAIDVADAELSAVLHDLSAWVVVHCCGPFQQQEYRVAHACIAAGSHYIDLADGREFVAGFHTLHAQARSRGVALISGASSVPGVSSAVVADLAKDWSRIDSIDIGIAPGNRAPRGLATVQAILSYIGMPMRRPRAGEKVSVRGWMDLRRYCFPPPVGVRWLANCDVPDLALFAEHFDAATVRFQAGLELRTLHFGMWAMALLSRAGLVRSWQRHARWLRAIADRLRGLGSAHGGMFVVVRGLDSQGLPQQSSWTLIATDGAGPNIPALPAQILVRKWLEQAPAAGARPCLSEFSLAEFQAAAASLPISMEITQQAAPLLVYDGVCGLCNRAVDFLIRHDPEGQLYFTHAQSPLGQRLMRNAGQDPVAMETIVLIDDDGSWDRSTAALGAVARLESSVRWLRLARILPRPLRDRLYDFVAKRRYRWFGRMASCRLPNQGECRRFVDV